MKFKMLPKFILSLSILGVILTLTISYFSYQNSRTYLEDMYAKQVITGSLSIARMLDAADVATIIAEGGDQTPEYAKVTALLNNLKQDLQITYLSLAVPDEDSVVFYIDTMVEEMGDDPLNQLPYGYDVAYVDAAADENDMKNYITTWELYSQNLGTSTPLITDNDYGYNYTSASPVLDENGQAIAEIQYILDMQSVRTHLTSLLNQLVMVSLGVVFVALVCYVLFVRKTVTAPINKLATFTQEITSSGTFDNQRIEMNTRDEIEELGNSFNFMMEELEQYIENLTAITAEKERIGAELGVATNIQASMLPSIFPAFPDRPEFDIYASMTPAKEVGGDFYDFFLVDDDHLAMVMADVSGKGVPAALFMVISKTLIKNATQQGLPPQDVLEKVNNQLCEGNEAEMFVTVWLGIYEISTGKLTAANAGHEYPAICRANEEFELFHDKHGFVLAGMEDMPYSQYELELHKGDTLYVYTDGVPEATDCSNTLFDNERLVESLNRHREKSLEGLLHGTKEDVDIFVGEAPQFDDITMLALRIKE
ncbi:MAG: SpoIIE family protein phosphatase [Eubacteriales bacterium]